jgi:hypothetical protein
VRLGGEANPTRNRGRETQEEREKMRVQAVKRRAGAPTYKLMRLAGAACRYQSVGLRRVFLYVYLTPKIHTTLLHTVLYIYDHLTPSCRLTGFVILDQAIGP